MREGSGSIPDMSNFVFLGANQQTQPSPRTLLSFDPNASDCIRLRCRVGRYLTCNCKLSIVVILSTKASEQLAKTCSRQSLCGSSPGYCGPPLHAGLHLRLSAPLLRYGSSCSVSVSPLASWWIMIRISVVYSMATVVFKEILASQALSECGR